MSYGANRVDIYGRVASYVDEFSKVVSPRIYLWKRTTHAEVIAPGHPYTADETLTADSGQ
jgi:hypothetical protein